MSYFAGGKIAPEEQAAFEHARQYGDRWYESHRVTARDAFLAGVKWAQEQREQQDAADAQAERLDPRR